MVALPRAQQCYQGFYCREMVEGFLFYLKRCISVFRLAVLLALFYGWLEELSRILMLFSPEPPFGKKQWIKDLFLSYAYDSFLVIKIRVAQA